MPATDAERHQDGARALAAHIQQLAPPGAHVHAEAAGVRLPFIPF